MAKRIFGKIFYTDEEAQALGLVQDPEERAHNERIAAQFKLLHDDDSPPSSTDELPPDTANYADDLLGTPYEGWTRQQLDELGETHDAQEIDVLHNPRDKHQQ